MIAEPLPANVRSGYCPKRDLARQSATALELDTITPMQGDPENSKDMPVGTEVARSTHTNNNTP